MLSYNDVYELLRKEKYGEVLQPLPKTFIIDISDYILAARAETGKEDDLFQENVIKAKKQLENSIGLFKELMRIRKRKILNLVFVATETGMMKRDYENMLSVEKEVFDKLVRAFEEGDKEVAKMMSGKKEKVDKHRMVMFHQNVEQFVDMNGNALGPFASGALANLDLEVAALFVSGGKASYVDEE